MLERGADYRSHDSGGERWRPTGVAADPREIVIKGQRLPEALRDGIVAPWSETLRYTPEAHGYHGGVTPQEVLVPLGMMVRPGAAPDGYVEHAEPLPAWWTGAWRAATSSEQSKPSRPRPVKAAKADDDPLLFDMHKTEAKAPAGNWIAALLASTRFQDAKTRTRRGYPGDDRLAAVLRALDAAGGSLIVTALAQALGVPEFRVSGAVAVMRRVLNVDGYAILSLDDAGTTVKLNRRLLNVQFELE